ncbi:MAG: retron Ec78 anti-phage system effector HNH endonuclease PtuB [Gallionella sp.]
MHALKRDTDAPAGLDRYKHGQDTWGNGIPSESVRQAIWDKLNAMQGGRCAYCEAAIGEGKRHIEHFRQRGRYPQGTFAWDNLFGSCHRQGCCGDHKDKQQYTPNDLIKPDEEDPEHFLIFAADGSVSPRANLSPQEKHRAEETIRIFNLDGALKQIRQRAISGYIQTAEEFASMAAVFDESEWLPLLEKEIQATAHLPHSTAIKHILSRQDP